MYPFACALCTAELFRFGPLGEFKKLFILNEFKILDSHFFNISSPSPYRFPCSAYLYYITFPHQFEAKTLKFLYGECTNLVCSFLRDHILSWNTQGVIDRSNLDRQRSYRSLVVTPL